MQLLEKEIAAGGENEKELKSQLATALCSVAELYMTDLWYASEFIKVHVCVGSALT